jgi:hypothetical protein
MSYQNLPVVFELDLMDIDLLDAIEDALESEYFNEYLH